MSTFDIHRTKALVARAVTGHGSACCVVTFEAFGHAAKLDRQAFGEGFLSAARIDAVHVVPAASDWYQHADFPDLCRHVEAFTRRYERVVAYGSSMGGYAAVRFGGSVGAHQAFALSPQFSIDPRRVPFDRRWADAARGLDFTTEAKASHFVDTAFIAYDPHDPDRRHVDLFRPHTEVVDIAIPYCGHPSSHYLREVGLLQKAVLDLAAGTFDATALRDLARARRKEAPAFYVALSRRARSDDTGAGARGTRDCTIIGGPDRPHPFRGGWPRGPAASPMRRRRWSARNLCSLVTRPCDALRPRCTSGPAISTVQSPWSRDYAGIPCRPMTIGRALPI